jgi:hypothetical protein
MALPRTRILSTLWRTLLVSAGAYWLGGTLFYITVVIHTGHRVLGSQGEVGFITREVTRQVNTIGAAVLTLLLVNVIVRFRSTSGGRRAAAWLLLATWVALGALQVGLLVLHPRIDRLLDPTAQSILDRRSFRSLHNTYMLLTTVQLTAGVLHLWVALTAWARADRHETQA